MATIYFDSTASGANDGTSWADAYTSLSSWSNVSAGDTVYMNAPESDPFYGATITITTDNVTVICDQGTDGVTVFVGCDLYSGAWTHEGSGVYSADSSPASEPQAVSYDYGQDDAAGTVTGIKASDSDHSDIYARHTWTEQDRCAWYGWLVKSASATTTPASGEWSYSGGTLYINPTGSQLPSDAVGVVEYAPNGRATNGVNLNASDVTIRGKRLYRCYPWTTSNAGYGEKGIGGSNNTLDGAIGVDLGWHHFGFASSAGQNCTMSNTLCHGGVLAASTGNGTSQLVHFADDSVLNASQRLASGRRTTTALVFAYGQLSTTGAMLTEDQRPLSSTGSVAFKPTRQHSGVGLTMGDVVWNKADAIDCTYYLNAKQGTSYDQLSSTFGGIDDCPAADLGETDFTVAGFDIANVAPVKSSFGSQFIDCIFTGELAKYVQQASGDLSDTQVLMQGCSLRRNIGGIASPSTDPTRLNLGTPPTIVYRFCDIFSGPVPAANNRAFVYGPNDTGFVFYDHCNIILQSTSSSYATLFVNLSGGSDIAMAARACVIASVGGSGNRAVSRSATFSQRTNAANGNEPYVFANDCIRSDTIDILLSVNGSSAETAATLIDILSSAGTATGNPGYTTLATDATMDTTPTSGSAILEAAKTEYDDLEGELGINGRPYDGTPGSHQFGRVASGSNAHILYQYLALQSNKRRREGA